tara:strand:+ start:724 stop:849 length:126 start_codon:yes stop_codon:yes gene_type:complete
MVHRHPFPEGYHPQTEIKYVIRTLFYEAFFIPKDKPGKKTF